MSTSWRSTGGTAVSRDRRVPVRAFVVIALVSVGLAVVPPLDDASAEGGVPGTLDPTFDVDGLAVNELVSQLSEVSDVERMPDGRLLVLADGRVWRFFADGTLDTSFDGDGVLAPPVVGTFVAAELALRPAGGFVVTSGDGVSNPSCPGGVVVKYEDDGSLVTGFDTDGVACINFPDFSGALITDVLVQADDQVVVLGAHQPAGLGQSIALARLSATGATVNTEVQPAPGDSSFEGPGEMILQPDGNILVSGDTNTFPNFLEIGVVLSRYIGSTLELDDAFGLGGVAEESVFLDRSDGPVLLGYTPDQLDGLDITVVVAGSEPDGPSRVARIQQLIFDNSGDLADSPVDVEVTGRSNVELDDLTVTAAGYVLTAHASEVTPDLPPAIVAVALRQQWSEPVPLVVSHAGADLEAFGGGGAVLFPDGTVLFTSALSGPAGGQFVFTRFIEDATSDPHTVSLDPMFGTAYGEAGFLVHNGVTRDRAEAVVVQPDSKVVVGGFTSSASAGPAGTLGDNGFVLRHLDDGALDSSFGSTSRPGVAFVDFEVRGVDVAPDGRIVAAGSRFFPSNGSSHQDGAVQLLLASGEPDTAWNDGFPVFANLGNTFFRDVAVQDDGKVVVVGDLVTCDPDVCDAWIAVARYLEDGTPDPDFGVEGVATIGPASVEATTIGDGIAIQGNGRIVVTGVLDDEFVIGRVSASGTPDGSFGTGGIASPALPGSGVGRDVAVSTTGRIVVAGDLVQVDCSTLVACFTSRRAMVVQVRTNGDPDTTFGTEGMALVTAAQSEGHGVAIDGAGDVVVGGNTLAGATGVDVLVARLTDSGDLDPAFGTNGIAVTDVGQAETGRGLALAPDGKILVAGATSDTRGTRVLTARYEAGSVLQCAPAPLDLGGVVLGDPASNGTVTCTNTGPSRLTITEITKSGPHAGDFTAATAGCLQTLVPAESCQIPVSFAPGAVGVRSATLSISYTAPTGTGPIAVGLTGTGIPPATITPDTTLTFQPPSLTFDERLGLSESPPQTVIVTNVGTVPVTINGVTIEADPDGDFAVSASTCTGVTLLPGERCEVSITFTPRAPGARTGLLRFDHTGAGSPRRLPLSGTGATPVLVVAPAVSHASNVVSVLGASFPPGHGLILQWLDPFTLTAAGVPEPPTIAAVADDGTFTTSMLVFPKSLLGSRLLHAFVGDFAADATLLVVAGSVGPDFVTRG